MERYEATMREKALRDVCYDFMGPVIAERFSEYHADWLIEDKKKDKKEIEYRLNVPHITRKFVDYLALRRRSLELGKIKNKIGIEELEHHEYIRLSYDLEFLILALETISEDIFEFKKTSNVQGFATSLVGILERELENQK